MNYVIAAALAIVLVAICITIHYEVMNVLARLTHSPRRHRWQVLITVYGLMAAHVVEIWLFGFGHMLAVERMSLGQLVGLTDDWFDYIYYSAMVYTTVGFGDIVPTHSLRMLSSTEALAGLGLITWSASFTFLQMQRLWRP
ncbi:MAG: potassium channel family protein [Pseudomonadales bacterium]